MIRGKSEPVKVPIKAELHNRFDFEVIDSVTGEIKQRAYAENIILDAYWTRIFTPNTANTYIHVGTGTGTLTAARTSLFSFLAGKAYTTIEYSQNISEGWLAIKKSAQWSEVENKNTAWTEVGVAYGATSSNLTTHALIKDINGKAVKINKGTTDIITVYSTIYAYFPKAGFLDGNVVAFNTPLSGMERPSELFTWMLGLGGASASYWPLREAYAHMGDCIKAGGSAVGGLLIGDTTVTGSAATKTITSVCPRIAAGTANYGAGLKGLTFGASQAAYPNDIFVKFPNSAYPYSTITAESIGTGDGATLDFATAFPFVKNDSSFVLYKNGVALAYGTDYTVDFAIPNQNVMEYYFNIIERGWFRIEPGQTMPKLTVGFHADATKDYCIFENPFYATYGINSVKIQGCEVFVSDSASGPWTSIGSKLHGGEYLTITVAAENQNKRYWKITSYDSSNTTSIFKAYDFLCDALASKKNIHFVTAPASGDTITADYRTDVIAKDANHVFDLTVELTLQEKTT